MKTGAQIGNLSTGTQLQNINALNPLLKTAYNVVEALGLEGKYSFLLKIHKLISKMIRLIRQLL